MARNGTNQHQLTAWAITCVCLLSLGSVSATLVPFTPLPAHLIHPKLRINANSETESPRRDRNLQVASPTNASCPSTTCSVCPTAGQLSSVKKLTFPGVTAGRYLTHLGLTTGLTTVLHLGDNVKQAGVGVGACCQLCSRHVKCAYWTWKKTGSTQGTCHLYTSEQCGPVGAHKDFRYRPKHSLQPPASFSFPRCGPSRLPKSRSKRAATKPPGPVCGGLGVCCSNQYPKLPPGTPSVGTSWYQSDPKSMLADGAKIQIRAPTWQHWWQPSDGVNWVAAITCQNYQQPPLTVTFRVKRVSSTQIQLITPNGTYVRAGPPNPSVASSAFPTMDTTTDGSDPRTYLTPLPCPGRPHAVFFLCYDNLYISSNGEWLGRWASRGSDWESFDIIETAQVAAVRGPNLGSWLAFENWMVPGLYPNPRPWNDGTAVRFQSVSTGMYISAAGGAQLACNRQQGYSSETFYIERPQPSGGPFNFKTSGSFQYWSTANGGAGSHILADQSSVGAKGLESFTLVFSPDGTKVAIQAPNGFFLQTTPAGDLIANVASWLISGVASQQWGASAFTISNVNNGVNGEWQFAYENGATANATIQNFHNSFITEADWAYMAKQQVNAVRIPVGWWMMTDPQTEAPFVGSYSTVLDWAFRMGQKYKIRIWVDLHALKGSQSGVANTAVRDGLGQWLNPSNVNVHLNFISWLCQRYVPNPMFLGIGLVNEAYTTSSPLDLYQQYLTRAYALVRTYSQCLIVSMSARIYSNEWADVLWLNLNHDTTNVWIEVHNYDVFSGLNLNATQEVAHVKNDVGLFIQMLQSVGRPILVGEFSNAMSAGNVDNAPQTAFSTQQMQTFAQAQAGWFFWSYKLNRAGYVQWDFVRSSANGWLPKNPNTGTWY